MEKLLFTSALMIGLFAEAQPASTNQQAQVLTKPKIEKQKKSIELQANKASKLPIENLIKSFEIKQSPAQLSLGGQDGNGGDSVLDPSTQKRVLLDLTEKDDLEYFLPETVLIPPARSAGRFVT